MQLLIFETGGVALALPTDRVREVVRLLALGPSPGRYYMGTVSWRDKPLAVLSAEHFGVQGAKPRFAMVVGARDALIGVPAERVMGIAEIEETEVDEPPPNSARWLAGVARGAWVVDPDELLAPRAEAEALAARDEAEFLKWCARTLSEMAQRTDSGDIARAARALEKHLGKKRK